MAYLVASFLIILHVIAVLNANSPVCGQPVEQVAVYPDDPSSVPGNAAGPNGNDSIVAGPKHKRQTFTGSDWVFPEENKRKCEIKCDEYIQTNPSGCMRKQRSEGEFYTTVVGGEPALPTEFPHMVALGWKSSDGPSIDFLCGGTLISDRWVLTAAHCTHGSWGVPSVVRIGVTDLKDPLEKLIRIERIQRHPAYRPPAMYLDIALLKLAEAVKFEKGVSPACLYTEDIDPRTVWATGWGATNYGEEGSTSLMKASLEVMGSAECSERYNESRTIPRGLIGSMVCAADLSGGWKKDTCQGDSGGPIQVIHPDSKCHYKVFGITSFGKLCAQQNWPSVYTRVSHFLDWIEPIVWPD